MPKKKKQKWAILSNSLHLYFPHFLHLIFFHGSPFPLRFPPAMAHSFPCLTPYPDSELPLGFAADPASAFMSRFFLPFSPERFSDDQKINSAGAINLYLDPIYGGLLDHAFFEARFCTQNSESCPEPLPFGVSKLSGLASNLFQSLPDASLKARISTPRSEFRHEFSSSDLTVTLKQGLPEASLKARFSTPKSEFWPETSPSGQSDLPELTAGVSNPTSRNFPESSPSKRHSPTPEDSDGGLKNSCRKKRKAQQKRVVHIPITGETKQRGETPPSDLWAWRKYGQKPIKGSPYPRNYYRCSSSKGCSARKQVERSRTDPSMLVITYTADHNHSWPDNRNSSRGSTSVTATTGISTPTGPNMEDSSQSQDGSTVCEPSENLFSCIINSPNAADEQFVSSLEMMQLEECASLPEDDMDPYLYSSKLQEDDFFADLGELPDMGAMFRKGFLAEKKGDGSITVEGSDRNNCDSWQLSELLMGNHSICRV